MLGPNGGQDLNISRVDWGVIPRASEYLFDLLEQRAQEGGFKYIAKASFLQIYNEKLYDLLRSTSDDTELKIREIPHANPQTKCQVEISLYLLIISLVEIYFKAKSALVVFIHS